MPRLIEIRNLLAVATLSANGDAWAAALPCGDSAACIINVVKTGVVDAATLTVKTGPAATNLLAADHANAAINASANGEHLITNLSKFLQLTVSTWNGTGSIAVTVNLIAHRSEGNQFIQHKTVFEAVSKGADGTLWTAPLPIGDFPACIVHSIKTGVVTGGVLTLSTGTDPASLATVDHSNAAIDIKTASVQKFVGGLNKYLQATISGWVGAGSVSIQITLVGMRTS
jgi:hypothetical protein